MKKKKTSKFLITLLALMYLTVAISGLIFSTTRYIGQLHNVDLTYNVLQLSNKLNNYYHDNDENIYLLDFDKIADEYEIGKTIPMSNLFISSMNILFFIHYAFIGFGFLGGLSIAMLSYYK